MVPSSDWVDVEEVIKNTSSNLPVGQLFAVGNFSLFDAMSAVEIGNPKMDANMTLSANVDDLLEQGLAPQELSSHQVLAIMDHLFLMEATWHTGGSLAQTLFSCLYMLRPERAQGNLYLNSFCQTLRAATSEVRSLMFTGCVCEDEDCNPNAFGLPLDEGSGAITAEKVAAALTLAVDHLRHLKQYNRHTSNGVKTEDSGANGKLVLPDHVGPVLARLLFRQNFLEGLLRMQRHSKQDLSDAAEHFQMALAELAKVKSTFGAEGEPELGFHPHVNRHLLGPAPPRQCKIMSADAAMQYFATLLAHLCQACSIHQVADYSGLQTFLEDFSRGEPCTLARSLLHIQINHNTRDVSGPAFPWSPDQTMMCNCMNIQDQPDLPPDLAMFLEQCLIAVGNYCQAMLLNRSRLRRRLRSGLVDWHNLWTHATNAEICPQVQALLRERGWTWQPVDEKGEDVLGPLALWVERETCHNMLLHLFLGMELQLYQPYEFGQIYWYSNYLLNLMVSHMKQLQEWQPPPSAASPPPSKTATPAANKPAPAAGGRRGAAARKGRRNQPEPKAAVAAKQGAQSTPGPEVLNRDALLHMRDVWMTEIYRFMAEGMMRLMLGLQQVGAVSQGPQRYNSERERFDLRFGSFTQLAKPEPLPYEYFKATTDCSKITPEALLTIASESFAQARRSSQILMNSTSLGVTATQAAQIKAMDRVAMHNMLAGKVVSNATSRAGLTATFNFSHHAFFPAVAVKHK